MLSKNFYPIKAGKFDQLKQVTFFSTKMQHPQLKEMEKCAEIEEEYSEEEEEEYEDEIQIIEEEWEFNCPKFYDFKNLQEPIEGIDNWFGKTQLFFKNIKLILGTKESLILQHPLRPNDPLEPLYVQKKKFLPTIGKAPNFATSSRAKKREEKEKTVKTTHQTKKETISKLFSKPKIVTKKEPLKTKSTIEKPVSTLSRPVKVQKHTTHSSTISSKSQTNSTLNKKAISSSKLMQPTISSSNGYNSTNPISKGTQSSKLISKPSSKVLSSKSTLYSSKSTTSNAKPIVTKSTSAFNKPINTKPNYDHVKSKLQMNQPTTIVKKENDSLKTNLPTLTTIKNKELEEYQMKTKDIKIETLIGKIDLTTNHNVVNTDEALKYIERIRKEKNQEKGSIDQIQKKFTDFRI